MEQNNYNVCFVCTGNACRSPFAETVMKTMLANEPELKVDLWSCGTLDWGKNPRDADMVSTAKDMGYTMEGNTTHMTREALLKADRIVVFSHEHRDKITQMLDYSNWDRIILFDMLAFGQLNEVEDPNYQAMAVYKRIASHIEDGCRSIVAKWKANPPVPRENQPQ